MKNIISLIALLCFATSVWSQQVPAKKQEGSILIMNAKAHLGNGKVIENSAIGFKDGKLTLVADATTIRIDQSAYGKVIRAEGKQIYPGFIAPNTNLGLSEIGAVRSTRDNREVGEYNANIRSIIAYNTDSRITPTIRSNGILLAQITPEGSRITGTSSIVELDGWNWEDAAYKLDDGVAMNWISPYSFKGWWEGKPPTENKKYEEEVMNVKAYFKEAKAYLSSTPTVKNLRFEAMRSLFNKEKQLFVNVNYSRGIIDVIDLAKEMDIKVVVVGGIESYMVADLLKKNNIPVVLDRTQRNPFTEDTDIDQPFKTPKILQDKGVLFCLSERGSWGQRTLPFQAGQAVSYGLGYEQGVQALTLNSAKILGIDKTVGSLEVGKDATLFISEGDALDMRTCKVETAFIQGKEIDLDNKQKALYRKFKAKYEDGR